VDKTRKVPELNKQPLVTEESDGADPWDERSSPKTTDSSSAVRVDSATSVDRVENGASRVNVATDVQQTNQMNSDSPNAAERSQSTVF